MLELILPGCDKAKHTLQLYTANDCHEHKDVTCALMMQSVVDCDNQEFLQERIDNARHTNMTKKSALRAQISLMLDAIQKDLDDMQMKSVPSCIRIASCGHIFSAVPLLYEFMTSGFKCPLCRHGSGQIIDHAAQTVSPSNMQADLWHILCVLCECVRRPCENAQEQELRQVVIDSFNSAMFPTSPGEFTIFVVSTHSFPYHLASTSNQFAVHSSDHSTPGG